MRNPPRTHWFRAVSLATWLFLAPYDAARGDDPGTASPPARQIRQPVALVVVDGGKTLLVANRRSGSLSVIDTAARRVVAEQSVGRGLAGLAVLPDGKHLLAVDQAANDLLLLAHHDRLIRVVDRRSVSPDPVGLVVSADGLSCVVASRWLRRLTFVGLAPRAPEDPHPAISIAGSLDLPFCPREMAASPDGSKLVVADAFGGRLAVVDTKRRAIESVRSLPAHNIRGLAFAPDGRTLLMSHQVLNRLAQTSFDDVHWGLLIRNHLRVVNTDALLKAGTIRRGSPVMGYGSCVHEACPISPAKPATVATPDPAETDDRRSPNPTDTALLDGSRLFDLGDVGYAAGDPGAIASDHRGHVIVALAGMDEVAITAGVDQGPHRIVVGRQPTALAISPDGEFVYVADRLDDTISVVAIATGQRPATVSLGPRPEPTAADRGERLFSNARLSHDGWMSCQSCHTDGHTNSLVSDTLGDGSYGAPKRVPTLLGAAATGPWTWTGSIAGLEDQVRKSIVTTMQGTKPTDVQVADLTVYLTTLAPPAPKLWKGEPDAKTVARGRAVFESRKCAMCHVPPEYTSPERYDVGLSDEVGNHEFNPPALRGVSLRDALLHDGRARSLEDVFQKERHPRGMVLSPREIADLVAFLETL